MTVQKMLTVTLTQPLQVGDTTVTSVTLRQPSAGELRGLSLIDVAKMETDALMRLLPRITNPPLPPAVCKSMGPVDFMALAREVSGMFFSEDQIEAEMRAMDGSVEDAEFTPLPAAEGT